MVTETQSRVVAERGTGTIYLAEHPAIAERVALEVLHAEIKNNPSPIPGTRGTSSRR